MYPENLILKTQRENHLKAIGWSFVANIIAIAFLRFLMGIYLELYILMGTIVLLNVLLHIRFSLKNRNKTIAIGDDRILVTDKRGNTTCYLFSDIKIMFINRSVRLEMKGVIHIPFSPFEFYSYLKLVTYKNEKIIITNFMCWDLDKVLERLEGIHFYRERVPKFFRW